MKFQRDRCSAHTAAFRSQAVPPQRPVAGRRCLNLVQPRPASLRTQYPVRGRCRLSRSQRAPRITAAAHPKVSPGRNPNPARSHHLRPRNARSARSSSPSSRPSSSWRSSSAELPHSSSFTAGRTRPRAPCRPATRLMQRRRKRKSNPRRRSKAKSGQRSHHDQLRLQLRHLRLGVGRRRSGFRRNALRQRRCELQQ